jgi:hypothetical protein
MMILKGIHCTMCGTFIMGIPALEADFEDRGYVFDRLVLCSGHRQVMAHC